MTGGQSKRARQRLRKQESNETVRSSARDNIEILRELPGVDMALVSDIDRKLLVSPVFNYEEEGGIGEPPVSHPPPPSSLYIPVGATPPLATTSSPTWRQLTLDVHTSRI